MCCDAKAQASSSRCSCSRCSTRTYGTRCASSSSAAGRSCSQTPASAAVVARRENEVEDGNRVSQSRRSATASPVAPRLMASATRGVGLAAVSSEQVADQVTLQARRVVGTQDRAGCERDGAFDDGHEFRGGDGCPRREGFDDVAALGSVTVRLLVPVERRSRCQPVAASRPVPGEAEVPTGSLQRSCRSDSSPSACGGPDRGC